MYSVDFADVEPLQHEGKWAEAGERMIEAARHGTDVIITDHHEMSDQLPRATAIVHPRLPGSHYAFSGLCGAGVALKLAWALCQRASQSKKVSPRLKEFLMTAVGLAAVGTVAAAARRW